MTRLGFQKNSLTGRRAFLALVSGIVVAISLLTFGVPGTRAAGTGNGSDHVRWDIIDLFSFGPPISFRAGGVAFASAPNNLRIRLTGSGTFIAPASGGTSNAVTGGGTWETFNGTTPTGRGTYWATGLASWEFANFQLPVTNDLIADVSQAANGNAILRIQYSDGSTGTLGIGCAGPGAPAGIVEGVIATKSFVTYWNAEPPLPGVNLNRTVFHVLK